MKRIAVFGKPGGGKSTFSKRLSALTGIQHVPLDVIRYQQDGEPVTLEKYTAKHTDWLAAPSWIIDGLGSIESFWQRIEAADTLVYMDLPYYMHYWWVTKRLCKSLWVKPEGWPEGSSVLKGTLTSWQYLKLSPKFWTPALFEKIQQRSEGKTIVIIKSAKDIEAFFDSI